MKLSAFEIAQMLDLSCVKIDNTEADIDELVNSAKKYKCGHVSVLQCYIPKVKELLKNEPNIKVVGNVGFPSGGDSINIKALQAKELIEQGCDEIDMVINVGKLKSKKYKEVEKEIKTIKNIANGIPLKVILEVMCLTNDEIKKGCELCINAGAMFVKTGTGWSKGVTTLDHIKLIKSVIGDKIKIKASGGIRNLDTLTKMFLAGATRFGVNLKSGISILEECASLPGGAVTF